MTWQVDVEPSAAEAPSMIRPAEDLGTRASISKKKLKKYGQAADAKPKKAPQNKKDRKQA